MAEKKLVFVIESIGDEKVIKSLAELRLVYKDLTKQIADANKSGDRKLFDDLSVAQEKVKQQIQETTKVLKDQKKEFEIAKYPTDSLKALEHEYGQLTKSIRLMSEEQRNSISGSNMIAKAKELKELINEQSQAFGDNSKNIGNYTESIKKALEHPIKFLKGAGIAGIFATVGVKLYEMGSAAVEAFGKTEEGAKKLKPVELGFERLKSVGREFLFGIIEKILPVIETILPPITTAFSKVIAFIQGTSAAAGTLFTIIKSDAKIAFNDILILAQKAKKLLPGNDDVKSDARITQLRNENAELSKQLPTIDAVGKAYTAAYEKSIESSKEAVKNAKLATDENKKQSKERDTALEALKKKESELQKIIEDKAAKDTDYTKEIAEQIKLKIQILAIEKAIKDTQEEALFQAQRNIEAEKKLRAVQSQPLSTVSQNVTEVTQVGFYTDKSEEKRKKAFDSLQKLFGQQDALSQKQREKEQKEYEDLQNKKKEIYQQTTQALIKGAGDLLLQDVENQKRANEKIRDERLSALNDEYKKKEAFAAGNSELLARLEAERRVKEEAINKAAAKKAQQLAIKQAIINGAVAAIAAVARTGLLLSALPVAAETLAAIALIKSQKFNLGGHTGRGTNVRDSTGKRIAGVVHQDEYVVPDFIVKDNPDVINDLERQRKAKLSGKSSRSYAVELIQGDRLRKYADGGYASSPVLFNLRSQQSSKSNLNTNTTISDDQMLFFAQTVALHTARETASAVIKGLDRDYRRRDREKDFEHRLQG